MRTLIQPTPMADLVVIVDDDVVVGAGFGDPGPVAARLGIDLAPTPTVDLDMSRRPGDLGSAGGAGSPGGAEVAKRLASWAAGDLTALDPIAVRQEGTAFQHAVWQALTEIPVGQTRSYAQVAAMVGRPGAVRAVGSACARNALAPLVPCHRVVRSDGEVGAYAYGTPVKRWLLAHERGQD